MASQSRLTDYDGYGPVTQHAPEAPPPLNPGGPDLEVSRASAVAQHTFWGSMAAFVETMVTVPHGWEIDTSPHHPFLRAVGMKLVLNCPT